MSTLYFDLQCGISGDMVVGALLDLEADASPAGGEAFGAEGPSGAPPRGEAPRSGARALERLEERLALLDLGGYRVECERERRSGIPGNRFRVVVADDQPERSYADIRRIIESSGLDEREKSLALDVFSRLARAESRVHGVPAEDVHFHEVGAVDSIVDIVGFAVLYARGGFENALASPLSLGGGTAESAHGTIPVPAPATIELVRGLPVRGVDAPYELTTPTGAAIVAAVVGRFGPLPGCVIRRSGTGFGKRTSPGVNGLRLLELDRAAEDGNDPSAPARGELLVAGIETTIDDSTPEEIGFLTETLFERGALDVFVTPVYMKKNRPAFNLSVLCEPRELDSFARTLLERSSTFGLRYQYYRRRVLDRKVERVDTPFGPIALKVGYLGGEAVKVSPEYDDCRAAALSHDVPLREVYLAALKARPSPAGAPPAGPRRDGLRGADTDGEASGRQRRPRGPASR